MRQKSLKWCFGLRDGIKVMEPSERLSVSYSQEARASLIRAGRNFADGDLLWATIVAYYAEYYALYAFLQRIGVKCENHLCSIMAASLLLGEHKVQTIELHKSKRIDAQYYMRVDKEEQVRAMLVEAKTFVALFDNIVSNLAEKDILGYREALKRARG